MSPTTPRGAPYPTGGDANNVPGRLQALAGWVNDHPGVSVMLSASRVALVGAERWEGRLVYESDTDRLVMYDGAAWKRVTAEATASGEWQAYTPTWSGVLAPGSSEGRHRVTGRTCSVRAAVVKEDTAPLGGVLLVTVPHPIANWLGVLGVASSDMANQVASVVRHSSTQLRINLNLAGGTDGRISLTAEYEIA